MKKLRAAPHEFSIIQTRQEEVTQVEDKELKKKLAKIPDVDKNGDPIYKIADIKTPADKPRKKQNPVSK